jgi:AcrR family transcriptional regulator
MARAASSRGRTKSRVRDPAQDILETALEIAEVEGWGKVRLRVVADRLGLSMADVLVYYKDLDAVANAWFRRGWDAMLQPPPDGFDDLPTRDRLEIVIMRWFDALAPHRRITGQMLSAKFWYAHPHHWVPAIFDLSRTIQWVREAAKLDATGLQRQMEEVGLTGLFLATLRVWLRDSSANQENTRAFLKRRLALADRTMAIILARRSHRRNDPAEPEESTPTT